jgi:hypothetical protein
VLRIARAVALVKVDRGHSSFDATTSPARDPRRNMAIELPFFARKRQLSCLFAARADY